MCKMTMSLFPTALFIAQRDAVNDWHHFPTIASKSDRCFFFSAQRQTHSSDSSARRIQNIASPAQGMTMAIGQMLTLVSPGAQASIPQRRSDRLPEVVSPSPHSLSGQFASRMKKATLSSLCRQSTHRMGTDGTIESRPVHHSPTHSAVKG